MNVIRQFKIIVLITATVVFSSAIFAQENRPADAPRPQDDSRPADNKPQDPRSGALRQLGLSKDQLQNIRRLNVERKPLMDEAQTRFREASRALSEAIYADVADEAVIQTRLKEVQNAQSDISRLRFANELAVRKILTPEQLFRFRELRQRFERAKEMIETQRKANRETAPGEARPMVNNQQPNIQPPLRRFNQQNRPKQRLQ